MILCLDRGRASSPGIFFGFWRLFGKNRRVPALLLSLLAAAGYGLSDFFGGLATRRTTVLRVTAVSYPLGFVVLAALAGFDGGTLTWATVAIGALAGVFSGLAILTYYAALASGPMSVISPLTALLVAGLPLGVGVLIGERPGPVALAGAVLAVGAVVLVSRQSPAPAEDTGPHSRFTGNAAWYTFGAGATFAVYILLLDRVGHDSGLWPLVIARASASVLVLAAAGFTRQWRPISGAPLRMAVLTGCLDVVANVAFLLALRAGLLSLVSVLTSLYPAATVLLANLVLGERTNRVQRWGLVLAVVAVSMIAGTTA